LPVGQPVEFELESPDVIHSFWIPSLGGKMDMIPGRRTRLMLHPTRTGTFRGACAEYCGTSHALMAFDVVVTEEAEFLRWLAQQRSPAREPAEPLALAGREHFFVNGCSACHAIRGSEARGVVGPDLTHIGSRLSIGAGIVPNGPDGFSRWIAKTDQVKPGVSMPHFGMLPRDELNALSDYLESLQ
jgi:cytochrome c oxidase subunit 2